MTFANNARFLDWLADVRAFNRQHARVRVGARSGGGDAGARFAVKRPSRSRRAARSHRIDASSPLLPSEPPDPTV
jgi:hypothetical protein